MLKEISGVLKIKRKNNNKNRTEPKTGTLKEIHFLAGSVFPPIYIYVKQEAIAG